MSEREGPNSPQASDMLKAICSAGERCSCADKNYQWYDAGCKIGIAHVNAISLRLGHPAQCALSHGLDNDQQIFFYEQDFYVLSNFSSFTLMWREKRFDTSEAAYHWMKFMPDEVGIAAMIRRAPSAHEAFKLAEHYKSVRRKDWDEVKIGIMRDILRAKASQHEYVRRKLIATGERELIENSWRDDFWGWGPNRDGRNMLGKLWMEIRDEVKATALPSTHRVSSTRVAKVRTSHHRNKEEAARLQALVDKRCARDGDDAPALPPADGGTPK